MKTNQDILANIQNALARDPATKNCLDNIYILVHDGSVIIAGSVPDAFLRGHATNIVGSIPGVNLLINDLKVDALRPHRVGVQIDWATGRMAVA